VAKEEVMGEAKRRLDAGKDWTQTPRYAAERAKDLADQEAHERRRIEWERRHGADARRGVALIYDKFVRKS
jgi:hypothetical protein